ncbi:MAG: MFS transporter [Eubacteriales bacterium]|nr:MFS transporter [Eubacteriales bacterium]
MFREIFNWNNEFGRGRCCMLYSAWIFKFLRDVIIGTLYVAYLSSIGFTLNEVSILSSVWLASSFCSFLSAAILERFPRRRYVLLIGKLLYYLLNLVGLTVIPLFVSDRASLMVIFTVIIFVSGALFNIVNGGYLTWHSNFVKGDNAAYYFSVQQTTMNIFGSIFLLGMSRFVDHFKAGGNAGWVFLVVRGIAVLFAVTDLFVLSIPKEYPYPKSTERIELKNLVLIPFGHKKFIMTMGIYAIWLLSMGLTETVGFYHLQNEVGVSMTLLNMYTPMYALLLLLTSGFWRMVISKKSWLVTFGIAGMLHAPSVLLTAFVTGSNAYWLYLVIIMIQSVAGVGLNLADLNMVYVNTPDVDQTYYIGFFSMLQNLGPFIGKLIGGIFIGILGERTVLFAGIPFGSVRFLYVFQFIGLMVCSLLFIATRKRLMPDRKEIRT